MRQRRQKEGMEGSCSGSAVRKMNSIAIPRTSCHPPSHPCPSQRLSLSISKKEDATYLSFRIVLGIKKDQNLHMKTDGIEVIIKQLPMKK